MNRDWWSTVLLIIVGLSVIVVFVLLMAATADAHYYDKQYAERRLERLSSITDNRALLSRWAKVEKNRYRAAPKGTRCHRYWFRLAQWYGRYAQQSHPGAQHWMLTLAVGHEDWFVRLCGRPAGYPLHRAADDA